MDVLRLNRREELVIKVLENSSRLRSHAKLPPLLTKPVVDVPTTGDAVASSANLRAARIDTPQSQPTTTAVW
jgi:hypothetical protein